MRRKCDNCEKEYDEDEVGYLILDYEGEEWHLCSSKCIIYCFSDPYPNE